MNNGVLEAFASAFVVAGAVLFVWASVRHTNTGIWPKRMMIASPLCFMVGRALLLGAN